MWNLLVGILLATLSAVLFYYLWRWCNGADEKKKANNSRRLTMKPVYAQEIEPGIVVLQSEDGEYFKILKEYDMTQTGNRYGSLAITRPEVQQPMHDGHASAETSSMLVPMRAQDSFHTRAPTAPSELLRLELGNGGQNGQPPPYNY